MINSPNLYQPVCIQPHVLLLGARDPLGTIVNFNTRIMHYAADPHNKCFVITSSQVLIFWVLFWILSLYITSDAWFWKSFSAVVLLYRVKQRDKSRTISSSRNSSSPDSPHPSARCWGVPCSTTRPLLGLTLVFPLLQGKHRAAGRPLECSLEGKRANLYCKKYFWHSYNYL